MQPEIKILQEKKLVGMSMTMSLADNKTSELWKCFMQRRNEITNNIGSLLYSLQVYDELYFSNFKPSNEFRKYAAIEVTDFDSLPKDMQSFVLPSGLYAVFQYKGFPSEGYKIFQYIFATWLPNSIYNLDNRPHFELLGEKYNNQSPDSEEELWIPIKKKLN